MFAKRHFSFFVFILFVAVLSLPSVSSALDERFQEASTGSVSSEVIKSLSPAEVDQIMASRDLQSPMKGVPSAGGAVADGVIADDAPVLLPHQPEAVYSDIFAEVGAEAGDQFKTAAVKTDDFRLKHFGLDFFNLPDAARVDPLAQVGPDYVIGPGDSLRIDLWGNIDARYEAVVDRDGEISLPKVGVVNLWGQTFSEAKETIRKQIGKYFTNFEFNISMGALRSIQIFLVGEVKAPGTHQISSLSSVMTALSSLGGPTISGSLRNIQLLRGGKLVTTIDFYDFLLAGDKSQDARLQSGDTIFVPLATPLVGIAGNVRRPAVYELKGDEVLEDVLALAGGIIPTAYLQKVQVARVEAHDKKVVLDLNLGLGTDMEGSDLAFMMQDRDLVKISPISISGDYVSLKGHVVRAGDYQLTEGMRLSDLILPYDNLLPEFYPGTAQVIRVQPPEFRPEMLTVNLRQALEGNPDHNILLQEYDQISVFSREEMEEITEVRINGAVLRPGIFRLFDKMTVKDLISAAGNLKRMAYLDEAELTRVIPKGLGVDVQHQIIDLKKALEGDLEHNLVLMPDDHLVIRSIPDFGDREIVEIRGEVQFPGFYPIVKGEALSSVLRRAGGYTDRSYLRGTFFARESLKEHQRQRILQLIAEEEEQIARVSADMARGALGAEDVLAAESILQTRQELVNKLKELPVSGRMVIALKPLDELEGSDDDVLLLDGDVLTIPDNPRSVSVFGEIYNPTSLLYRPGKSSGFYLKKVGGPKENADIDNMFIIRADGTVYSRQQAGILWVFNAFKATELHPGDTILVPEEFKTTDVLKEIKDFSTIIYQLALGAAAVASF